MAEIIWDSELGPSWPNDWEHTTVHAQFVAVTGDGADTDRLPDIAPSGNGEVIFTPSLRTVRYVGAEGPYVVSLKQYRAVVDNEGYLCTPDTFGQPGERGIVLPSTDAEVLEPRGEDDNAFTWRVDFDLPAVTIRSDHIAVPVGGPYNLVDLLSPERAAGVVHIIDRVSARDAIQAAQEATAARDLVLPARDQTLAARDETLAHGITVDTSVGTRVFVGNTMIYGDTGWRELPLPDRFISGRVLIKRENNDVTLRFETVEISGLENVTVSDYLTSSGYIPHGFRPAKYEDRPAAFFIGSYAQYRGYISIAQQSRLLYLASTVDQNLGTGNARVSGEVTWTTTPVWPTIEPGTPA